MRAPLRKALGVGRQSLLPRCRYSTSTHVILTNPSRPKTWTRRIGDVAYYSISAYFFYQFYTFAKAQLFEEASNETGHTRPPPTHSSSGTDRQGTPSTSNATKIDLAADGAIVIPLSWPKQRPPEYYAGSSKEWQDFRSLAFDAQRRSDIRVAVAKKALSEFFKEEGSKVLGDKDVRVSGIGLDFEFPQSKPTRYERYVLVFSGRSILLGKQIMKQEDYVRVRNILTPWPAVKAVLGSYKVWRKARENPNGPYGRIFLFPATPSEKSPSSPKTPTSNETLFGSWFSSANSLQIPRSDDAEQDQNTSGGKQSLFRRLPSTNGLFLGNPETRMQLANCGHAFRYLMHLSFKSTKPRPDGLCYLHGEVAFRGNKHCGKLHVMAVVMPATGEIVDVSSRVLHVKTNAISPKIV